MRNTVKVKSVEGVIVTISSQSIVRIHCKLNFEKYEARGGYLMTLKKPGYTEPVMFFTKDLEQFNRCEGYHVLRSGEVFSFKWETVDAEQRFQREMRRLSILKQTIN